jgi:hypothetical protein
LVLSGRIVVSFFTKHFGMRIPKLISLTLSLCVSLIGLANNPTSIDLTIVDFEATRVSDHAEIRWVSSTSQRYTIEKSLDGENWQEVIEVKGALSSESKIEYFDIDTDVPNSRLFYRIMRIDKNNKAVYSPIAFVPAVNDLLFLSQEKAIKTIPQNISKGTKIDLPFQTHLKKNLIIVLRNTRGQEYYAKVVYLGENADYLVADSSGVLPEGSYTITATTRPETYHSNFHIGE